MSAFHVAVSGETLAELKVNLLATVAALCGTAGKAETSSGANAAKTIAKGDATVSTPNKGKNKPAEPEAEDESEGEVEEPDALADDDDVEEAAPTRQDVKDILSEVRENVKDGTTKMMAILEKYGVSKLGELKESKFGDVIADAKKLLAKKK